MLCDDLTQDLALGVLLALLDPGIRFAMTGSDERHRLAPVIGAFSGATLSSVEEADFVFVSDGAEETVAARAFRGTPLQPERGATVIYAGQWPKVEVTLRAPGRGRDELLALPIPVAELDALAGANVDGPMGVDALIIDGPSLRGLPRSVSIVRSKQVA
jgi:alpha-D-ribose 1-methylphosphonate 5-triphosphate synthase subunit PhnH